MPSSGFKLPRGWSRSGLRFARPCRWRSSVSVADTFALPAIGRPGYGHTVDPTLRVRKPGHGVCRLRWSPPSGPATTNAGTCKPTWPPTSFPARCARRERRPVAGRPRGPALRRGIVCPAVRAVVVRADHCGRETQNPDRRQRPATDRQPSPACQTRIRLADHHWRLDGQRRPAALCRHLVEPGCCVRF